MPVHRHPVAVPKLNASLAHVPLDRALVARLKATYVLVRSDELRLAQIFYARLFAAAPQLRSMFRAEPIEQARKLTAALDAVVRNFDCPAENAALISDLGRRHAQYGAKPEHYDLVIDLLIESMREVLGPAASEEGLGEWRTALRLISNQMIQAAG